MVCLFKRHVSDVWNLKRPVHVQQWVSDIKLLSCSLSSHYNLPKGAQWLHFSCTCLPVSSTELHSICMPSWQFLLFPRNINTVCYRSVLHCHILFCYRCNGHSPQHNRNTWISWKIFSSYLVHEWFPSSSWSSVSIQIWSWRCSRHTHNRWEWNVWYFERELQSGGPDCIH